MDWRQQTWFVLLMTFVLSWSSVSIANAQSIHTIGLSTNTAVLSQTQQHGHNAHAVQPVPCHEMPTSTHMAPQTASCHTMDHALQSHQQGCLDCHTLHCHHVNVVLDTQVPTLQRPLYLPLLQQLNAQYLVQDLTGYWQEILRPPKA